MLYTQTNCYIHTITTHYSPCCTQNHTAIATQLHLNIYNLHSIKLISSCLQAEQISPKLSAPHVISIGQAILSSAGLPILRAFSMFWMSTNSAGGVRNCNLLHIRAQWSLYIPHNGHYVYRQIHIQHFYILTSQCIYVFCVDLRTNSHYFLIQH